MPVQTTQGEQADWTTVSVRRPVAERLESLKPYESLSYSEFLDELCDAYEKEVPT